jgi:hypothetical protein
MPLFENRVTSYADDDYSIRERADGGKAKKVSPRFHKCDLPDLDYSRVADGRITCTICERYWLAGSYGWWPYPCPGCNSDPKYCHHYGKKKWTKKSE